MIFGRSKKARRLGADRRWTLLFIGDHGNVIALKHFKVIVVAGAFIFFSALCALAILFFVNHGTAAKNKELQRFREKSETQIETLRHEKEVLMARLVIAESKANKSGAEDRQSQGEKNTTGQITPKPQAAAKEPADKVDQKVPPPPQTAQPKPLPEETPKPAPVLSVAVENFSVIYEPESENLNVQFKIKNTSPQSQPVSGHTVVVLKNDDLPIQEWLVMPAVAMVGDTPSGNKGKTFSIQRFRTMNFTFKAPDNFDEFQTAVVYVFLKSGELLLEEDFPVTLPPPPVRALPEPKSETPSSD
jgi:predicted component of type VI protein secretion system